MHLGDLGGFKKVFKSRDKILGQDIVFGNRPTKPHSDPAKGKRPNFCKRCAKRSGLTVFLNDYFIEHRGRGLVIKYCPYCDREIIDGLKDAARWGKIKIDNLSETGSSAEDFYGEAKDRYEKAMKKLDEICDEMWKGGGIVT